MWCYRWTWVVTAAVATTVAFGGVVSAFRTNALAARLLAPEQAPFCSGLFPRALFEPELELQTSARLVTYALLCGDPAEPRWESTIEELGRHTLTDPIAIYRYLLVRFLKDGVVARRSLAAASASLTAESSQLLFYQARRYTKAGHVREAGLATELAYLMDSGWSNQSDRGYAAWAAGKRYQNDGKLNAATGAFQIAIQAFVSAGGMDYAAYSYRRLGEIALAEGRPESARVPLLMSLVMSPEHADAYQLAKLLKSEGVSGSDIYRMFDRVCQARETSSPCCRASTANALLAIDFPGLALDLLRVVSRKKATLGCFDGVDRQLHFRDSADSRDSH